MKHIYCFFIFVWFCFRSFGQDMERVAHCPSNEVYDMLVDKKGFIWVAHNLGVSRYDGITFTSFSNPDETSISMTDLLEDNFGRIWCHNFNGQVFYIKDDKMFYLKEYDFKKEVLFPRMVLNGDELVVTSNSGLFVCNTATLACRYLRIGHGSEVAGPTSVCVIDSTVIVYGGNIWYVYDSKNGFRRMDNSEIALLPRLGVGASLQPETYGNMCFVIENRIAVMYGLAFVNKKLVTVFEQHEPSYINTISIVNGKPWINTQQKSFSLYGEGAVDGHNLTIIQNDNEGNSWFGSLTEGLLVRLRPSPWKKIFYNTLKSRDPIRLLSKTDLSVIAVTQHGRVFQQNLPGGIKFSPISNSAPENATVTNILNAGNGNLFIEANNHLYIFYTEARRMARVDTASIKDIAVNGKTAYLAESVGVEVKNISNWGLNNSSGAFSVADSIIIKIESRRRCLKKLRRCRALLLDTSANSLLISFTDGLQRLKDNKLSYVLYKGVPLYVSSLVSYNNKIYAATFNKGLFVIDKYTVTKIENNAEAPLDGIVRIKLCNRHLWIFRVHDIEVLDAETARFINMFPFPADITEITDIEEDSSNIYLAASTGLYAAPLAARTVTEKARPALLYVLVNNTDTVLQNNISLPANKNNLLFRFAIPVYNNAAQLHFKYRLLSDNDTAANIWYYTQDAQRDIQFNALKPGSYAIELFAVKNSIVLNNIPLVYHFTVNKPWYNTWWFYLSVLLLAVSASVALYQYRLHQLVKIESMRRKISNDLHDDIGSTLSSINVYSQLAKGDRDNDGYINAIQNNTVSIINSLDDLVWNINPKNDPLGQLVSRIQLFALPLLQERDIVCFFRARISTPEFNIAPNARANIYLLFKEMVNNVIKHSGCTQCSIYFIQKGNLLRLVVQDNGKGFSVKNAGQHRNGLRIMAERAKELKGSADIKSAPGEGTQIKITCHLR